MTPELGQCAGYAGHASYSSWKHRRHTGRPQQDPGEWHAQLNQATGGPERTCKTGPKDDQGGLWLPFYPSSRPVSSGCCRSCFEDPRAAARPADKK